MKLFKLNPVKKKFVYHYSKIAPLGKELVIKLDNGVKYFFRAGTLDRTTIKEVWARKIYSKYNFQINETDTVVDIGGHIGSFSIYAAKAAFNGKVFSFEPFADNFKLLSKNIELNKLQNVKAENAAISNKVGEGILYLQSQDSKTKVGYNTGGHSFFKNDRNATELKVKTETLESLMNKHNIDRINFLKLDCEGAEFDILFHSSSDTLKKVDKMVMELHVFGDNTKDKMVSFLQKNNYTIDIDQYGGDLYMLYARR